MYSSLSSNRRVHRCPPNLPRLHRDLRPTCRAGRRRVRLATTWAWPVGVFGKTESALEFQRISPAPMGSAHTSGRSRPLPIYFIFSPIDSWPQPALLFYKRVYHPLPLTGVSLLPLLLTGVAMPTLPLLFAALFAATAQAAVPTFGHNVVPYIPQVSRFLSVSIPWAVPIISPVILLRLERPNRPFTKSHDRPMRHHKYQVE